SFVNEAKFYLSEVYNSSKIKLFITMFILFVSLLVGIILAFKYNSNLSMNLLEDYGIVSFVGKGITSSFFSRLLSILLIMLILFGCSFTKFLMPLAVIVLAFRTYLLGFNLCLMFLTYGLPGIFISVFIILPCQLFILLTFCVFYFLLTNKSSCGVGDNGIKGKLKIVLLFILIMVVLCLAETLLLLIFNASVIIVI
ncbi:MAG: hypothetical protein NC218_12465, partial [Acetobacter sp.]|nr:hypothetical protein [Acetobacter sp.]